MELSAALGTAARYAVQAAWGLEWTARIVAGGDDFRDRNSRGISTRRAKSTLAPCADDTLDCGRSILISSVGDDRNGKPDGGDRPWGQQIAALHQYVTAIIGRADVID